MTLSLERRAARWGDRTAVVDVSEGRRYAPAETIDADRVSYADLSAAAASVAGRLAGRGIDAGDTVCVCTRDRVAALATLFACRRLGATFAPISHRLTPATVSRPLDALDPDIVVSEPAQRDLVRDLPPARTAALDDLADVDPDPVDPTPPTDSGPLLALHGEPGTPVVAFSADAVERNCVAAVATWGLGPADVAMPFVPLSTPDGLLRAALPTLYVGGTVLLDRAFDPGDALAAVAREGATVLVGRAAAFRDLAAEASGDALGSVAWGVCEAPLPEDVRNPYLERGVPIVRAYGRVECPTACCQSRAACDREGVGRPILDCEARLVDDGDVLGGAAEGTLELSGPVLADGYVERGDAADERVETAEAAEGRTVGDVAPAPAGERPAGAFADGRFDTGERFRRDERGEYRRA